jgi:hypothetical protein
MDSSRQLFSLQLFALRDLGPRVLEVASTIQGTLGSF